MANNAWMKSPTCGNDQRDAIAWLEPGGGERAGADERLGEQGAVGQQRRLAVMLDGAQSPPGGRRGHQRVGQRRLAVHD